MVKYRDNMIKSKLILIAGGTASGKSMIADIFKKVLDETEKTTIIRMDNYYKTLDDLGETTVSNINWDEPRVFDWEKLSIDIDSLLDGKNVVRNIYCYKTGYYKSDKITLIPNKNLIVEGLFMLYNETLRKKSSLSIYVDVDHEIRMKRRMKRDSLNIRYGSTFDKQGFVLKWNDVIQPMHEKYVKKTKEYANEIIYNNEDLNKEKNLIKIKKIIDNNK